MAYILETGAEAFDNAARAFDIKHMKVGNLLKHPDFKKPVKILQIKGDMIAVGAIPPIGGGEYRIWVNLKSF